MMEECRYCSRKPVFDDGYFNAFENEEDVGNGCYTGLTIGIDIDGNLIISACGDDRSVYYPKYCPECGRKL